MKKEITLKLMVVVVTLAAIAAITLMTVNGCKKADPVPSTNPIHQNFDMVQVKLSGEKAQITNNQFEYDFDKNCWKVQVKMLKESKIGGMLKTFSGKDSIKLGTETRTLYERELETYVETKDSTKEG